MPQTFGTQHLREELEDVFVSGLEALADDDRVLRHPGQASCETHWGQNINEANTTTSRRLRVKG